MPGEQRRLGLGRGVLGAVARDDDGAVRAEAAEAPHSFELRPHDWLVVIGVAEELADVAELLEPAFCAVATFAVVGISA